MVCTHLYLEILFEELQTKLKSTYYDNIIVMGYFEKNCITDNIDNRNYEFRVFI